jgi:hypothetical protein
MAKAAIIAELACVALIAAAAFGFRLRDAGIASGYVDPILHATAQDEAVYGHAAANMVHTGHWLTPRFLDRFMLNKPPLLMWAGAASMRLFGVNRVALRLPALVAAVLSCLLVYYWVRRSLPLPAAFSAVLLLLGNALFHSMGRKFMTDIVLTVCIVGAMVTVALDPRFQRWASAGVFGVLSGAAILTKSAAGLVPLLILMIYFFLLRPESRPAPSRIVIAFAAAFAIAAPWHLYQFLMHGDWFLAEYVNFQILGSGVTAPSRYSSDSSVAFYAQRLFETDPVLLLLCCFGLYCIGLAWSRAGEEWEARLLTAWCLGSVAVLLAFGTRVAYYLLPLIPAMVLVSVRFSPLFRGRWSMVMCALLTLAFAVKIWRVGAPWALDYQHETVPSASALLKYSQLRRANDLIIVAPDDEFFSATLDLPKLRYVYPGILDPTKTSNFFEQLGVNLSPHDFCNLPALLPVYEQRLATWREADTEGLGSLILADGEADVSQIIQCSPTSDFFLPDAMRELALQSGGRAHSAMPTEGGRFFFLARTSARRPDSQHASGAIIEPN